MPEDVKKAKAKAEKPAEKPVTPEVTEPAKSAATGPKITEEKAAVNARTAAEQAAGREALKRHAPKAA